MSVETEDLQIDIDILTDKLRIFAALELIRRDFIQWPILDWQAAETGIFVLCEDSKSPEVIHGCSPFESELRFIVEAGEVVHLSASHDDLTDYVKTWPTITGGE